MVGFLAALPFIQMGVQGLGQYFQSRDVAKFQKKFAKDQAKRNAISALSQGRIQMQSPEPQFQPGALSQGFQAAGQGLQAFQMARQAGSALKAQNLARQRAQQQIDITEGQGSVLADPSAAGVGLGGQLLDTRGGAARPAGVGGLRPLKAPGVGATQLDLEPVPGLSPEGGGASNAFNLGRGQAIAQQNQILQTQANADRTFGLQRDQFDSQEEYRAASLAMEELKINANALRYAAAGSAERNELLAKSRSSLQSILQSNPMVKTKEAINRALTNAWVGYKRDDSAGHLQLAKAVAIFQDPGSTVRESELAAVEDIQTVWEKGGLAFQELFGGDKQRFIQSSSEDLMSLIVQSYGQREAAVNETIAGFVTSALDDPGAPGRDVLERAAQPFRLGAMADVIPKEDLDRLIASAPIRADMLKPGGSSSGTGSGNRDADVNVSNLDAAIDLAISRKSGQELDGVTRADRGLGGIITGKHNPGQDTVKATNGVAGLQLRDLRHDGNLVKSGDSNAKLMRPEDLPAEDFANTIQPGSILGRPLPGPLGFSTQYNQILRQLPMHYRTALESGRITLEQAQALVRKGGLGLNTLNIRPLSTGNRLVLGQGG